jgi:uncharacterized protein YciI
MFTQLSIAAVLPLLVLSPVPSQPGFTTYLIAFMTAAPGQDKAGGSLQELRKSHDAYLAAMWKEGVLAASGAVGDNSDLEAVLVFAGDQRELIDKRLAEAPLVKAGLVQAALGPWIAPIGIGDEHRKRVAANPGVPATMRTYQLVMLKTTLGKLMEPDDQRGLIGQMDAMAKAGKLAIAGPVLEGSDLAWVFVFDADAEETDALTAANPAVKSGKMRAERHPWMVPDGVLPAGFQVPRP